MLDSSLVTPPAGLLAGIPTPPPMPVPVPVSVSTSGEGINWPASLLLTAGGTLAVIGLLMSHHAAAETPRG